MFEKIASTEYPPSEKPLMVWDGECGFCAYWIARWHKVTGSEIDYEPFQEVSGQFPDIDQRHFAGASRLIEIDGSIFSGPRSAYRSLSYGSRWGFLDRWYAQSSIFATFSDKLYNWVAGHRHFMMKATKSLFGSDPQQPRPFWAIYLALLAYIIYIL